MTYMANCCTKHPTSTICIYSFAERPLPHVARALEILTIALGNPGPRDPSVHAAMSAGVGGSPAAAALMAALAAGAIVRRAREVLLAMEVGPAAVAT